MCKIVKVIHEIDTEATGILAHCVNVITFNHLKHKKGTKKFVPLLNF